MPPNRNTVQASSSWVVAMTSSRPFFVLGAQRSGTTILSDTLAENQSIFLTIEGKLLYYLITWVGRDPDPRPGWQIRLDEIAYSLKRKPISGIDAVAVSEMIEHLETGFPVGRFLHATSRDIVRNIWFDIYKRLAHGKPVFGDKYSEYLLQIQEIIALFPDAKYIFIHRDPFDVAESAVRTFRDHSWAPTLNIAFAKWAAWNQNWLDARESIPIENRLEISYKNFVECPEDVISGACRFLGVPCSHSYTSMALRRVRRDRLGEGKSLSVYLHEVESLAPSVESVCNRLGYDADNFLAYRN